MQKTIAAARKWDALTRAARMKLLTREMPQPRWESLRNRMADMTADQMTQAQVEAMQYMVER